MPAHGPHRSVTVILPTELVDALDEASRARDIGRRWLIERLLAEGVERLIPVEELRLTRPLARLQPGEPRPNSRTTRRVEDGVVHEMADLGVKTMCGLELREPWEWTEYPISCALCADLDHG